MHVVRQARYGRECSVASAGRAAPALEHAGALPCKACACAVIPRKPCDGENMAASRQCES
jgi:hypothetical protein